MAERLELEYRVSVTGLGEAAVAAESASRSAGQASLSLQGARSSASRTLPVMLMGVRSMNAARLAVEQTTMAIEDLDPRAAMYGFLNMVQVVRYETQDMKEEIEDLKKQIKEMAEDAEDKDRDKDE